MATLLHPNRWFARFLETSWMVRIGLVSYSLYIWQQLFLSYRVEDSPLGWLQIFPANLVAAFVAAFASYYWIEQPCRHFGRRLFMATNERTIYKRPDTSESKP